MWTSSSALQFVCVSGQRSSCCRQDAAATKIRPSIFVYIIILLREIITCVCFLLHCFHKLPSMFVGISASNVCELPDRRLLQPYSSTRLAKSSWQTVTVVLHARI